MTLKNFIQAMDFAKASYNSIHGEIKAEWQKLAEDQYEYLIEIPANCSATVILPDRKETVGAGQHQFLVNQQ